MKQKTERDKEEKSESLLLSLYQKFVKRRDSAKTEKTDQPEEQSAQERAQPPDLGEPPADSETKQTAEIPTYDASQMTVTLLSLQKFYGLWAQENSTPVRDPGCGSYIGNLPPPWDDETTDLLKKLDTEAEGILKAAESTENVTPRPKIDGRVEVAVSKDGLRAWIFVFPPLFGGTPASAEAASAALKAAGVTTGVDEETVAQAVQERAYMRLFLAAAGTPPVNGEDGRIEEVIPHTVGTPYMQSDKDVIDYKNLNWLVHVEEKQLICRVVLPTPGKSGLSVQGKEISCTPGKKPDLPIGANTQLSEDGTEITAKVEGQIFYENNRYKVMDVIQIQGDVDLSTGNINVKGNVFVQGNVRDSFIVRATGDINIAGSVGMATVEAGGNIFVRNGINGNEQGTLRAGGEIKCRYIESAKVYAAGNLYADSIANSTVVCGSSVLAESGHGVIIGGSITAMEGIRAKEVGNERGQVTRLSLECTPEFLELRKSVTKEFQEIQSKIETAQQQTDVLKKGEKDPKIQAALKDIHFRLSIFLVKQEKLKKLMNEIEEKEEKLDMAQIRVVTMYPTVAARINGVSHIFNKEATNCLIFRSGTDLELGRTS